MILLQEMSIQGTRGVLKVKKIPFGASSEMSSTAIFAPNATGKSGIADAVEYFFSLEGEVEHLGKGADTEKGGKNSLIHIRASKHNIEPKINFSFYDHSKGKPFVVERKVKTGTKDPAPDEVQQLLERAPAHRILRQHDLRQFVVEKGPNDKYDQVAKWIGFDAVRKVQDLLKTAEHDFSSYNFDKEIEERKNDLVTSTNNSVKEYDTAKIESWVNDEIVPIILPDFEKTEPRHIKFDEIKGLIGKIEELYNEAFKNLGGGDLSRVQEDIGLLLKQPSKSGQITPSSLDDLNEKLEKLNKFQKEFELEKGAAKDYIFESVWQSARTFIEANREISNCPVCGTQLELTIHKNAVTLQKHLEGHLESIKKVRDAEGKLKQSLNSSYDTIRIVREKITSIESLLTKLNIKNTCDELILWKELKAQIEFPTEKERNKRLYEILSLCKFAEVESLRSQLKLLSDDVGEKLRNISEKTDKYKNASQNLGKVLYGYNRVQLLKKQNEVALNLLRNLQKIVSAYNTKTTEFFNMVLNTLEVDINAIFGKIHGKSFVPKIYFKLSPDKDKAIDLMVDFHDHNNPVKPAGYLSESYINTLGVAIFLSSAKRFNKEFPFIMLDDVVSSYDAEHRSKIARVIIEDFSDFQIFLTTHDKVFFQEVREMARGRKWTFMKFKSWSIESGPELESEYTSDSDIENASKDRSNPGIAGNLVRQAMEEWFDKKCDTFLAFTVHKSGERNVKRELNELWPAFDKRVKDLGKLINDWYEVHASVDRLRKSAFLGNLLSHHQADPYVWTSTADAEALWEDFKAYRQLFVCEFCGKDLVYAKEFSKVICKTTGCGGTLPPKKA